MMTVMTTRQVEVPAMKMTTGAQLRSLEEFFMEGAHKRTTLK
jgi:hypothetical protein